MGAYERPATRRQPLVSGRTAGAALLERAFDRTFDAVYALAFAATAEEPAAERLAQETYDRAARTLARGRGGEEALVTAIYRVAWQVVDQGGHRGEGAAGRTRALAPARQVLALRAAGLDVAQIARVTGQSERNVRRLQLEALRSLREGEAQ